MSVVYQVVLPPAVTAMLSSFEVVISIGLDLTAPFECLRPGVTPAGGGEAHAGAGI